MAMRIIKEVMTILMQLIWKVVQPEELKLGDNIYTYALYGLYSHHVGPRDKLSPRVGRCIFMGYPNLKKGYRVLDISTKEFLTTLDENTGMITSPRGVLPDDAMPQGPTYIPIAKSRHIPPTNSFLPAPTSTPAERPNCSEDILESRLKDPNGIEEEYDKGTSQNDDPILRDPSRYQRLVEKLIYLTMTRPDISYAVQTLSQFMHSPKQSHLEAALKLVKYLKKCPGLGILLSKRCDMKMKAYFDADYATCPTSRRSVTGYCIKLGDSLLSWKTKKQPTVSLSSAEAKYRAMAKTTC
ncbi:uncharacterized protein LOC120287427 [Eucalyptus grandis]|uniref:uncharacterized protein LOC120287427 n=1 Tax=Eucalyptus grandis TaxID=71139 RepID=UPI00192ECC0F|nr:uncharacterized protein LOC120287427 [Eucalyptus grandis]